jgi:RNA polymerase sigma factor (sigma-70 family)
MQHALVSEGEIERLYREQGTRLWGAVLAYARDRSIADDAVAEAFAQLLRRGSQVRDTKAWIWTTAFRIAAGELQRRHLLIPEVPEDAYEPTLADTEILAAVMRLPERQRAAVLLHYYADRSAVDAARALGMTPSTFRVHLHRARKTLSQQLGDDHA